MTKHTLKAQPRTLTGRAVKKIRSSGVTPANIFGKKVSSLAIQINTKEFSKIFREVGESTLLYLQLEGEKDERPVLVREVVKHPVSGQLLHISFNQVDLKEKVTAPVSIELVGEAPAETEKLGILVKQLDEVEIEALPTDMPENIQVNITSLAQVGDSIAVKDLKLNTTKLKVETESDTVIVRIEALAAEEPVEAPVAEAPAGEEGTAPAAEGETTETASTEEKKEEKSE